MDTPVIRTAGALLAIGLACAIQTKWDPPVLTPVSNAAEMAVVEKHMAAGDYAGARAPAIELYSAHPENQIYIQQLAAIDGHLGRYKDESDLWEKYLQYSPTPIEACPQIGVAYNRQNLTSKAVDALERCLRIEPNNPDVLSTLGNTWERAGDAVKAAEFYQRGLTSEPESPDLIVGMGRLALRRGDTKAAGAAASRVLTAYPDNSDALLLSGLTAMRDDNLTLAKTSLQHAMRVSQHDADIRLALGQLYERASDPVNALVVYREAMRLDPSNKTAADRIAALDGKINNGKSNQ